jgi:hypothetical protein
MHFSQKSVLEVGYRVQKFLDEHAETLGRVSKAQVRAQLDAEVKGLAECFATQAKEKTAKTSRTKLKNTVRKDLLKEHIEPIVEIARAKPSETPGIASLRNPPKRANDGAVVTKAIAIADAVKPYEKKFLEQQLPRDFIDQLRAKAKELLDECNARDACIVRHVAATKGAANHDSMVRDAVFVLNTLVIKQLAGQDGLLSAWRALKRYRRKPGPRRPYRKKKKGE